jgi:hypothetical protein
MPKNYRLMSPAEKRAAAGLLREAHLLLVGMGIPEQPGLQEGFDRLMDEWKAGLPTKTDVPPDWRERILSGELETDPKWIGEDMRREARR